MKLPHDQSYRLIPSDPLYCGAIARVVEDCEDITSQAVIAEDAVGSARIVVNEGGVLAGQQEVLFLVPELSFLKEDGQAVAAGDVIVEWSGRLREILKMERTVLNLLSRMSGVATYTRRLTDELVRVYGDAAPLLCSTRKTLWGLLDKRAVAVGGGGTHRLDASDAILLKDNHLAHFDGDVAAMLSQFETYDGEMGQFVEVEVESVEDARKAFEGLHKLQLAVPCCVMLDNMALQDVIEIGHFRNANFADILLEASGGITEKNLADYAKTDVDVISMSALTMDAHTLDFSLELVSD